MEGKIFKIVSQKRTWYERLLAAVFYAIAIYIIIIFYINHGVSHSEKYYIISFRVLASLIVIISFGIRFSYITNHHFDLILNRYKTYYSVGPFGIGKWRKINKLSRVSTFLNSKNECEVNIWDVKNNKFKIAVFYEVDNAVIYGRDLAKDLKIKFKERNK